MPQVIYPQTGGSKTIAGILGKVKSYTLAQHTDIIQDSIFQLLNIFQSKAESASGPTAANYRKAVICLRSFIVSRPPCASPTDLSITTKFLEDWFIFMFFRGLTAKTSLHYFDLIAGLANKEITDGELIIRFRNIKARIKEIASEKWRMLVTEESFKRLVNLTKLADRQQDEAGLYTDILLFSLLNCGMDISAIAKLQCEDIHKYNLACQKIAERHISSKRKYVFPLEQSRKTPRQIEKTLSEKLSQLLGARNIMIIGNIQECIRSYWAYAALKCGVLPEMIIKALGHSPIGLPILAICSERKEAVSAEQKQLLSDSVTDLFIGNPPNWYAMRLRPGIKFDRLKERIADCKNEIVTPELFYPCQEIAKKLDRKLVFEKRPIIPDIVFFKSCVTDILPLFHKIGDLAWCYRNGDTYASIPQAAMETFQKAIGKFTPDYEIGPVGSIALRPGDRIVVVGGAFTGKEGEIIGQSLNENGVIYRIMLWGDNNNIEWRANDSRLIEKKSLL